MGHECNTPKPCTEPPYSVGQDSANDDNANVVYPTLDNRIRETYLADRKRGGSNSMFDSYIRAFRWATDRIGDTGIVGFVSNGGWIDGSTAAGMRVSLADDYAAIYIYNLRGNGRIAGERGRKEGRPIFEFGGWRSDGTEIKNSNGGSRATIVMVLLVKDALTTGPTRIYYTEVADYLTAGEKVRAVSTSDLDSVDWQPITPNSHGDWLNQRNANFSSWPTVGDKKNASKARIFSIYAYALLTARDAWVYNFSKTGLTSNVQRMLDFYNLESERVHRLRVVGVADPVKDIVSVDAKQISWTLCLRVS